MKTLFSTLLILPLLALFSAPGFAQGRTIIVLDASGSMWGRIDGKPKLEIARGALRGVLRSLPPDREVGLMAYGHRDRSSCSDIELLVAPAKGSAESIMSAAERLKFLGRTPLTEAVGRAAAALRHTKDKATVVLITDGLETCNADPCALATELKRTGVDFTAHVVGFGLSAEEGRKVACIAENTGGRYIQASDAKALENALAETVVKAEPAPPTAPVSDAPKQKSRHHPGLELMPHVGISASGGSTSDERGYPAEITFPPEGTIAQCQKACAADKLCAAWRYEPKGSYFVDHARCFLMAYSTEADYAFHDPSEGWASGMKPDARLLIRPFVPQADAEK